jgi:hypothetical protein
MSSEPPIIITGGSVNIQFDDHVFKKNPDGKFSHPNKKIQRIEINGDGINFVQDLPSGKVTIKIYYSDY